jgi:two-component system, cell cycle response regulator
MSGGNTQPHPLASPLDELTGAYNRSSALALLFRETDRAQRMKTPLSLLLFAIDDFAHRTLRLDAAVKNKLMREVVSRIERQLRCYDVLGRIEDDEFLAILPGCSAADATRLAERLRMDVFPRPFTVPNETIQLSACFGIALSKGRSPVVVLREAEVALKQAKEAGPASIRWFGADHDAVAESFPSNWLEDEPPVR